MNNISQQLENQARRRMHQDNPWWIDRHIPQDYADMPHRAYLSDFFQLVNDLSVRRAIILMGPRRVGKTVMIYHTIKKLIESGVDPRKIIYVSVDTPAYNNTSLEEFFIRALEILKNTNSPEGYFVFFDEIQYLKNWELHLKSLVDTYRSCRFIASGSAAAALKMKSAESGAGRFSDFMLPPLTFMEYLKFMDLDNLIIFNRALNDYDSIDISRLNSAFIDYINFGGYPEVVFSEAIRKNPSLYIKNDIIDKVLLRDLPSLYGISDIQELNKLFVHIAFRSGNEFSYENLATESGIKKETIKKYIEYLEAAFLIKVIHRIDQNAKRMQRVNQFKIFLTNPSLRCALFSPISQSDDFLGSMVETAIFAQIFQHGTSNIFYANWTINRQKGEVDLVKIDPATQKATACTEIKWTDRYANNPTELKSLRKFISQNPSLHDICVTSETVSGRWQLDGKPVRFVPAALYAYANSANLFRSAAR